MILSVLICSLYERAGMLAKLLREIYAQIEACDASDQVEVITIIDDRERTTGFKRNELYQQAKGLYSVSIDDDDRIPEYYIREILKAAKLNRDCICLNGEITTNGKERISWSISKDLPYDSVTEHGRTVLYRRYPNHICPIRTEITKQVQFKNITHGEDYAWATEIHNRKLIKTEIIINQPMYFYDYVSKK